MDEQALRIHFEMATRALCMDGFMVLVLGLMPVAKNNLKSPKFQEPCMVIGNKRVAAAASVTSNLGPPDYWRPKNVNGF